VYEKSIGTKMNDLDLRLEVVSRSCQPLIGLHLTSNISETVRFGSKGPPIGNGSRVIKWSLDRWRH